MIAPARPPNEPLRLKALQNLHILEPLPEERFDHTILGHQPMVVTDAMDQAPRRYAGRT